jgi:Pectate lyase superfamily protein
MDIGRRTLLVGGLRLGAGAAASAVARRAGLAPASPADGLPGAGPDAAAAGTGPGRSALWSEFVRSPYTHPQIPNVSYAGYRLGAPLPWSPVRVNALRFGAVRDGSADSAPAINRAIAAAGACGGGAVLLPPGRYRVDDVIQVGYSGVVLRGAGSGRTVLLPTRPLTELVGVYNGPFGGTNSGWSWTGGLVWVTHRDRYRDLVERIRAGAGTGAPEIWTGDTVLASVTADAAQGSFVLAVDDTRRLRAGQRVLLKLDDDARYGLLRHACGDVPGTVAYDWAARTKLLAWRPYVWPVRIARVGRRRVVLAQPLPLDARVGWRARLTTTGPVVTDAGVQGLTIQLPLLPQPRHLQDPGFNGLHFQCAWDCWADDVRVVNADNGFLMTGAKGVTLSRTRVAGRARHHSYACRERSHDNLVHDFAIEAATVPQAPGGNHHGINIEGLSSGNVWSAGRMDDGTFDTHRGLPFGTVRTQIVVDNDGLHGGSADAGPLYGARFAHWNITVLNGRAGGIKLDQLAPRSATVGISEVREFGQVDQPDFAGPLESRLESYGTTAVTPANLYLAQLRLRCGWHARPRPPR